MPRAHVAHLVVGLGLGGDAKNVLALARQQATWARVSIAALDASGGPRARSLPREIELFPGIDTVDKLVAWLGSSGVDVVIFHRAGPTSPWETTYAEAVSQRVGLFEFNTFGRHDPTTDALWAGQLHLCRATLVQYARRRGFDPLLAPDQLAAGYSLDEPPPIDPRERLEARRSLGIPDDALVSVRLMRPDLRKWEGTPVLAVRRARARGAKAHLLVREAPRERVGWLRRQLGSHVTLLHASTDERELRATLAAADCVANYSTIGETFGLALAEGMAAGLVALVDSTPEADNAQVELCEDGVTGFVATGVSALTSALVRLHGDPALRARLGAEARRSILARFGAPVVERRIRRFLIDRLRATGRPAWQNLVDPGPIDDGYALDSAWLAAHALAEARGATRAISPTGLLDDAQLRAQRFVDGARFARQIGPGNVLKVLGRRLRSGSLRRG